MTVTPDAFLADIPAWDGATWTEMSGGLTNRIWKVVNGDRAGVLKLDDEIRAEPFNTRTAEAIVQTTAAKAGLAANVIWATEGVYLTEYTEGTVWSRERLDQDENLARLAVALKRLHGLPLTGRHFDASVAAALYVENLSDVDAEIVAQCVAIVSTTRLPKNLCCCHNDLVAENIITTPALQFLDWEYACDNEPCFDLATIVEHHELSDVRVAYFLNAYFDGDGARWRERLEVQRRLYLALLYLWMASRPNGDRGELEKVMARLTTSYF